MDPMGGRRNMKSTVMRRVLLQLVLVGAVVVMSIPAVAQAQGVAMVLEVKGEVGVSAAEGPSRTARAMTIVEAGEVLSTAKDSSVTFVAFADGREFTLGPEASVELDEDGPQVETEALTVSRTPDRLALPKNCSLSSRRLMGEMIRDRRGARSRFVHPANFGQVRNGSLEFRWELQPPADKVVFVLYDPDDEIVLKQEVSGTAFVYPPEGHEPLGEDRYYFAEVYDVAAPLGSALGRAEAEFRVMTESEVDEVSAGEAAATEMLAESPDDPVPLMELMVLYLHHRLYDEAVETGRRLEAAMPDNPNLFRYMARAYASLGETEEAATARNRAEELERAG
jgi:hypothetical protein